MIQTGNIQEPSDTESENYVIRVGDKINLVVWGYPEFNAQVQVKENGFISLPLIGELLTAGLTKQQFMENLKEKLSVYITGEIKLNLDITSIMVQRVTVLGAVNRQDNYPINSEVSLIEVLSSAGGVTMDADLRRVKIIRNGLRAKPIEVDLIENIEKGDISNIPIVKPGDMVYVPKKHNIIRELSEFFRDAIFLLSLFRVFN
ncbi:MAG: Capsule polysaccharide export protein [Ignavibacteriae bacterium]|nr:MAG: Capsule polysaccharide export protein [Ignavibacteriota bacterium]